MPMDELLEQLELLDEEMLDRSDQASTAEEWTDFIDRRQRIVEAIVQYASLSPLLSEQKLRLTRIQMSEDKLRECMVSQKQEAADWLRQREQAKLQRNVYETAYSPESMLMDRRK
ncbi:hypothetical protein [Paenibacillus sanguinis]|uniref:hypothetical protein n=1 Tax=Paenibacillus sanguinis TaxID=225906 RepID=UPI00037BC35B|nr:hypothetical protein [Paenibacillus sanguinis]